jgi:hypothetical protein
VLSIYQHLKLTFDTQAMAFFNIRLALGFILTGISGGMIQRAFSEYEKETQQHYQEKVERTRDSINYTFKLIAEGGKPLDAIAMKNITKSIREDVNRDTTDLKSADADRISKDIELKLKLLNLK